MAAVESTAAAAVDFDGEVLGVDERGFPATLDVLRFALGGLAPFFRVSLREAFPFVRFLAIARLYEAIRPRATCVVAAAGRCHVRETAGRVRPE